MRRMRARSRLNARITLIVAAGALLVAAGVALLLSNTVALRNSAVSSQRADAHLLSVVNLERLVVDAETGLRGEVITGKTLFLQPLHRAQAEIPAAIAALHGAASENRSHERQSAALIGAVRSYMSGYVTNVLRLAAHDLPAARSLAVTLQGKHLVDGIRARVAQLERLISSSQTARERSARHTANSSIAEAIVILVLLTLLTAALGGYLGHLAVARERARDQSEETTRTLQQSIMPSAVPEIPGCELATRFIPGGGAVSGDFYDVLEVEPGEWALIIGDVCGKGAPAAAATAMARWTLRSALAQGATPAEALTLLNSVVLRQDPYGQFVTAACIRLTLEPESARLVIACAGHPAPIVVPRHDGPTAVAAEGGLLGILPTIHLDTAELQLRPGDGLVAYTDGVTDQGSEVRRSPEMALADRREGDGARELAQILEDLATHPVGRHPDDIAILALRFLGPGVSATQLSMEPQAQGKEILGAVPPQEG
jgi:serine phosphatase RsbU (regulator of sigma subunit)